ncbi:SDR family oxidoreductase [Patescibacteria group bacterium]
MSVYLITGGAGFVGSNIARVLVEMGETVRVLDDLSTGRLGNINPFIDQLEYIEGDFTDLEIAKEAVDGVDYVLHQAAIPSVPRSIDDPIGTNNANILGTLNMLVAARDSVRVKRFVYACSSSAYGDSLVMPKVESMAVSPKSPYAIQKLTGEQYCKTFFSLYGLPTVCLRYFNVFGPNQDPDSVYSAVIPIFINKMLRGESPIIYGDGTTSRDFTYVDNNVKANLLACDVSKVCNGEVINIACAYETSLNELVEKINEILGTNIRPIYKDERSGDVKHSLADIGKAKDLLGYQPLIDFDEGLKRTIAIMERLFHG